MTIKSKIPRQLNLSGLFPGKAPKGSHPNSFIHSSQHPYHRVIFIILVLASLVLLPLFAPQAGINADESYQVPQTKYILDYYTTLSKDRSIITDVPGPNAHYYGKLFEFISALAARITGHTSETDLGLHRIRHILSALFGWLIILFTGLLAKIPGGWRAGWIAILLALFTPRLLGHSFFNVKDIPFAAGYIMAVYFIVRYLREFPKPKRSSLAGVILGIALAINIRVGGLLLIAYFVIFTSLILLLQYRNSQNEFSIQNARKTFTGKILLPAVASYAAGLIFWPYALENPFLHPVEALSSFTRYGLNLRLVFEGIPLYSREIPWYYATKYLLLTLPLPVIGGLILSFFAVVKKIRFPGYIVYAFLVFSWIFPVVYVTIRNSDLYDGIRHLLFVFPPIIALSGIGWNALINKIKKPAWKLVPAGIMLILLINAASWTIRSHPYQYTFFNTFTRGLQGAYGKYETDYYMSSVKEASRWLANNELSANKSQKPPLILTNAHYSSRIYLSNYYQDSFELKYRSYHFRVNHNWDYAIFFCRYIDPVLLQMRLWPPKNAIYTVKRAGVPLCTVLIHENRKDFKGMRALKKNRPRKAIRHFKSYLKYNPLNEAVLFGLGKSCLKLGRAGEAEFWEKKSLTIAPSREFSLEELTKALIRQGKLTEAESTAKKLTGYNKYYSTAYYLLAEIERRKGNFERGAEYWKKGVSLDREQKGLEEEKVIQMYMDLGDTTLARKARKSYMEREMRFKDNELSRGGPGKIDRNLLTDLFQKIKNAKKIRQKKKYLSEVRSILSPVINTKDTLHPEWTKYLGIYHLFSNHFDSAIRYLENAHKKLQNDNNLRENLAIAYLNSGKQLFDQGKVHKSLEHNLKAYRYDSTNRFARRNVVTCYLNLGFRQMRNNQYRKATIHLKKALKYQPDNTDALTNLGVCYNNTGDIKKAIDFFQKTLQINPRQKAALQYIALCHQSLGNTSKARKYRKRLKRLQNQ